MLRGLDHRTIVSQYRYGTLYPFFCADASKRDVDATETDENTSYRIDVIANIPGAAAADVNGWLLVEVERKVLMNGYGRRIQIV